MHTCTGGDDRSTDQERGCGVPPQSKRVKLDPVQPPPPASLSSTPADTHSQGQGRGPGEADSETGNSHTEERSSTAGGDTGTVCCMHCTLFGVPSSLCAATAM